MRRRRRQLAWSVAAAAGAALLAGCASASTGLTSPTPTASPGTRLTVTVDAGNGGAPTTWTLTCDPPAGSHPQPVAACGQLEASATDPFAPTPSSMMCSMIYGGAQTATVSGTFHGRPVHTRFARTNGCEVARWQRVSALLAISVGAS